jgi:hypothetical protein
MSPRSSGFSPKWVTLDTVIAHYHQGDSLEAIHEGFDVLPLNDIYAVIAYYLAHCNELDAYLQRRKEEAERIRLEVEANKNPLSIKTGSTVPTIPTVPTQKLISWAHF